MMRKLHYLLALLLLLLMDCKREKRIYDPGATATQPASAAAAEAASKGKDIAGTASYSQYEGSAYAVGEGKRLYSAYNCVGCHQQGGGGIGPALMDSAWLYGNSPNQIYVSIVQGRPNGMPSFEGKIADYQVWELVAYVRSLSGQLPSDVAPSRADQTPVGKAEQAREKEKPTKDQTPPNPKEAH